jgi:outer membrane protein OmpA-like peptidoglycan-associated protein
MFIIIFYLNVFFSKGDVGTTMYPLLKIGVGPRAVALGEAYVGLADDITAAYWNPSGQSGLKRIQFFISHHEWFMDIRDEYFIFGMPGLNGYFTLGGVYSSIKDVEIWNENNMPLGVRNLWSGILSVAYGRRLKKNLSLGLGIKTMYEDLYEESISDFALDIGAKVILSDNFLAGGAIRNLSYKIEIPTDIKIGCCFRGIKNLNILTDLTLPSDNLIHINLGAEYNINRYLSVRSGWRSGPYDISQLGWISGFTAGFGITYAGLNLDYAFVPYGKLGITHRIALSGGLQFIRGVNSVVIKVMDGDSKQPLQASINLTGVKQGNFQTDKTGKLEFKNLNPGWLTINTFSPGYPQIIDSVNIYPEGKTEKIIYLYKIRPGIFRGIVFDAITRKPIGASVVYRGMAFGKIDNDTIAGSFVLKNLPAGIYILTVSGRDPKYIAQSCSITIESGKLTEREFYLIKKREPIVLHGINFDTGKAELKPEAYSVLDYAGRILVEHLDITVEIAGHTDPREINTTEYPTNWELSLARAEVVREYLIKKFDIHPEQLVARGYADTKPIAPNTTEDGMAKNRRTEFQVIED